MTWNQSYSHFEIARDATSIVYATITHSIWHATLINSCTRLPHAMHLASENQLWITNLLKSLVSHCLSHYNSFFYFCNSFQHFWIQPSIFASLSALSIYCHQAQLISSIPVHSPTTPLIQQKSHPLTTNLITHKQRPHKQRPRYLPLTTNTNQTTRSTIAY